MTTPIRLTRASGIPGGYRHYSSTSVDIKASGQDAITIETGGNATLTITEANTGNVALTIRM